MSLPTRREPVFDMRAMRDQMNRMFDSFLGGGPRWPFPFGREGESVPAVDVYETDDSIVVKAEVPGIPKENLEVTVEAGALTIRGERTSDEEVKEENYYHRERQWGGFKRTIPLPEGAKVEQAQARFENGILEVRVPKAAREVSKARIEIK